MATKIETFGTTKLTLAAHAQFNELVAGQIAASDLEALHLTVLAPPYLTAVAMEKEAVNRPSAFAVSINALIAQYELVAANQGKKHTTVV